MSCQIKSISTDVPWMINRSCVKEVLSMILRDEVSTIFFGSVGINLIPNLLSRFVFIFKVME